MSPMQNKKFEWNWKNEMISNEIADYGQIENVSRDHWRT